MNESLISIDLAKNVFQVCVLNQAGKVTSNKKVGRKKLLSYILQFEPGTIAMEACYSAHYWGREFESLGHKVNLVPAQHVTPFVRGNKNDANDAVAIAEASMRPGMRFVPVKTVSQQDIQTYHRMRQRHVRGRTSLVNQIRGLLSEYGIITSQGWRKLKSSLPTIIDNDDNQLSPSSRQAFKQLYEELLVLNDMLGEDEKMLKNLVNDNDDYNRLLTIPGFGPILSSAVISTVGNAFQFKSAREMAAWLGLTPKQIASGQQSRMQGITKRGNRYLRTLFIHGARAVVNWSSKKTDPLSQWINKLTVHRGVNKATVALAHKLARFAWAILTKHQVYKAPIAI